MQFHYVTCLAAQYFLTSSLDQYQTRCRGCAKKVDDPGHMFKGQGQTTLLRPVCCPLYIFLSLAKGFASTEQINLNFAPLGAYMFLKHFLFKKYINFTLFTSTLPPPYLPLGWGSCNWQYPYRCYQPTLVKIDTVLLEKMLTQDGRWTTTDANPYQ